MIDYIKALVMEPNIPSLEANPMLNFCSEFNSETGEIRKTNRNGSKKTPYRNAYHKSLEIRIYESGSVYLMGSLHKFWNNGQHNFNDFTYSALKSALNEIKQHFDISPGQLLLRNIEFGVNIISPVDIPTLLAHMFLHKTTCFRWVAVSNGGKYIQAEHTQYIIKAYDKSLHYMKQATDPSIFRFEVKVRKMEKLKGIDIKTVEDLIQTGFTPFTKVLLKEWDNTFIYDYTINHPYNNQDKYSNPNFWTNLISEKRNPALQKHRRKLKEITEHHSERIKEQISQLIQNKSLSLAEGVCKLTKQSKSIKSTKGMQIDQCTKNSGFDNGIKNDPLSIKSEYHNKTNHIIKTCKVTGVDISMQDKNSFLLAPTGMKFHEKHNPEIFNQIKRQYLSSRWIALSNEQQLEKMYCNIRAQMSDLRKKAKRNNPIGQLRLELHT